MVYSDEFKIEQIVINYITNAFNHLDDKKNFEQVDKIYNKIVYQEKQDQETMKNFERLLKECSAELNGLKKTCQKK